MSELTAHTMTHAAGNAVPDPYTIALDEIDIGNPAVLQSDFLPQYFARLRKEDPIHYCAQGTYGAYWSITRYKDILQVETNPQVFSSEKGGITLEDGNLGLDIEMFIAMDPPKHDDQRKVVSPALGPENLAKLAEGIRTRTGQLLDQLPVNETFDWVDRVSIELTTQMLALLFDFPWEDRRKLTLWSDTATAMTAHPSEAERNAGLATLGECAAYFTRLWNERVNAEPRPDLLSMLAHSEATRNMGPREFLGNLILLIVGGNDTTRNSMTGGLLALHDNPDQYRKLCENPKLIDSLVPEIIRWQTPVTSMRRTALRDTVLGGKTIREGDRVVMWYASANRDEEAIENPNAFIIDRARPRQHLSFGFGIHRCVGNRLAEMQIRILWEEILKRWPRPQIEVVGEPVRNTTYAIRNFRSMPVRINLCPFAA